MNRALVGEPGVSAFLRSVRQNLGGISRMEPIYTSPNFYDPREDLENLKEKLTFFQDLLVDGETRRQLGEERVEKWMDDLKDLLYDVEDTLDDLKGLRKDQVCDNFQILRKRKLSDDINSGFKNNILARAEKLEEKAKNLELKGVAGNASRGESKVTRHTGVVDLSDFHGREKDEADIVDRLLEVNAKGKMNYDVLCIVGMPGLGKTTLAHIVFDNPKVVEHFDVKSWVCISNVFDVRRATKELIENSGGVRGLGDLSQIRLQMDLKDLVQNKKILFVLDDVWSLSEWDIMKGPFSFCAKGSKILVTTRNTQIALALHNKEPYKLGELNHEKCLEIFRDRAFRDDEEEQEKDKKDLVEKIVKACKGLPLIVKVIGSMLQGADVEKWRAVSENILSWADKDEEIYPAIRYSYYDLSAPLKRCFEYLAVFPPDFKFDKDDVVRLWIADGLVMEEDGRMAEDIGKGYYDELIGRSLIQEDNMMHDIVHHLATVLSRKFCYKENSREHPVSKVRHAFLINLNAENYKFLAKAPSLRTLIVKEVKDENILRDTIKSCKILRTLKIGSYNNFNQWSLSIEKSYIDHLIHIRYLTIIGSDIKHLPDSLCKLDNLQFLDLHGNKYLGNLPHRMNDLSNLRCLILSYSSISSLPESIDGLSQLQVLDLTNCGRLRQLPKDIGLLRSLRTLHLKSTSLSSLPESICDLSKLQVLNLKDCRSLSQFPKDIKKLTNVRTLDIGGTRISSPISLIIS